MNQSTLDLDYHYLLNENLKQKLIQKEKQTIDETFEKEYIFYKKRIWKYTKDRIQHFMKEDNDTTTIKEDTMYYFRKYIYNVIQDMKVNDTHFLIQKEMNHIDNETNEVKQITEMNNFSSLYTIQEEDEPPKTIDLHSINKMLVNNSRNENKNKKHSLYTFVNVKHETKQEETKYPKNINVSIHKKLKSKKMKKRGLKKKDILSKEHT